MLFSYQYNVDAIARGAETVLSGLSEVKQYIMIICVFFELYKEA